MAEQMTEELCASYIPNGGAIDRQCGQLNRYSVRARYPRQIEITEAQLKQAVEDAKTILHYTLSLFPPQVGSGE